MHEIVKVACVVEIASFDPSKNKESQFLSGYPVFVLQYRVYHIRWFHPKRICACLQNCPPKIVTSG